MFYVSPLLKSIHVIFVYVRVLVFLILRNFLFGEVNLRSFTFPCLYFLWSCLFMISITHKLLLFFPLILIRFLTFHMLTSTMISNPYSQHLPIVKIYPSNTTRYWHFHLINCGKVHKINRLSFCTLIPL